MSASEAGTSAPHNDDHVAPVVMLHTRRRLLPAEETPPADARAAEFWRDTFAEHRLSLDDTAPIEQTLKIAAERLEAMVTGLLYMREGGGPRNLAPDPDTGVDYTAAAEVVALLREMKTAPAVARRMVQGG